jgi:hypothetical protein
MAFKSRKSPPKVTAPARKRGRPSREEELRTLIQNVGVDPDLVDPKRVLAGVAVDATAPASARVSAAKALLVAGGKLPAGAAGDDDPELDALSKRAIAIMSRRPN